VGNAVSSANFNSDSERAPNVTELITSKPMRPFILSSSIEASVKLGSKSIITPVSAPLPSALSAFSILLTERVTSFKLSNDSFDTAIACLFSAFCISLSISTFANSSGDNLSNPA